MRIDFREHRRAWQCGAFMACAGLFAGPARAATIPVACNPTALITAINNANSTAEPDTLVLAAACVYTLNAVNNTWYGPNGLPAISSDITLEGNGATIARSSAPAMPPFRFFYVSGTWSGLPAGKLTLRSLTLGNGLAQGGSSGSGGAGAGMGGAIFNQGDVLLSGVTLLDNRAIGGNTNISGLNAGGGGIGQDATTVNGGGFGASFAGGFGGSGGVGSGSGGGAGGGGGFAPSSNGGSGTFGAAGLGGGNSGWGSGNGDGGDGASFFPSGAAGNGGAFGSGGSSGVSGGAGGGGGVGGGGGAGTTGGGGGFGGGGGASGGPGYAGGAGGFGGGGANANHAGFGGGTAGTFGGGGGAGMGGAIFNHGGTLSLINSTLTANAAQGGLNTSLGAPGTTQGSGLGGAIFNLQGSVNLVHSTLAFNQVVNGSANGGALYNLGYLRGDDGGAASLVSQVTLQNSILSNSTNGGVQVADLANARPNVLANGSSNIATAQVSLDQHDIVVQSNGSNIFGVAITVDPQLGPLADNGGPTHTMAISCTGAAVDTGDAAMGLATDQRGYPRPVGPAPDIGAYEYGSLDVIFRDGFEGGACGP